MKEMTECPFSAHSVQGCEQTKGSTFREISFYGSDKEIK